MAKAIPAAKRKHVAESCCSAAGLKVTWLPKDRRTQGIDRPDVRKALNEVGYRGWVTVEVRSGDENYVKEVGARLDKILAGQNPV